MSFYRIETYTSPLSYAPMPTMYAVTKDDMPVDGHVYTDAAVAEHARACLDYADYGHTRRADGTYAQASTSLGGYPLIALTGDCSVLCSRCALMDLAAIPVAGAHLDSYDRIRRIKSFGVHYEGRPIQCDGCHRDIPSAYGPTPDELAEDADGEETHR